MKQKKGNILLVESMANSLHELKQKLSNKDLIFSTVYSCEDALRPALSQQFDLIVIDDQPGKLNGVEIAQILKSNNRTKDLPVLLVFNNKNEKLNRLNGMSEEGIGFIYRPFNDDITKIKIDALIRIQLLKRELEEKNEAIKRQNFIINNVDCLICVLDSPTLKFEEVNDAVLPILGYTQEEICGTSLALHLSSEDRILIQKDNLQDGSSFSFEAGIYTKTRTIKWLKWKISIKAGKWYANATDVTNVREVEDIRNYLSTVVRQSNDAIYLHDEQGKIISWNAEAREIYGYTESEALKMKVSNIIPLHLHSETNDIIDQLIAGNKVPARETKRINKQGRIIDILFSASLVIDSNGKLKSIAITERDITQKKIAAEQIQLLHQNLENNIQHLKTANDELEAFSHSVSHDLRSPLRSIIGFVKMINKDFGSKFEPELKELFGFIENSSKRMNHIIDDLLTLAKFGKENLKLGPVNMDNLVAKVCDSLMHSNPHNAKIVVDKLPVLQADGSMLEQVLVNLLSNAIKYSSKKENPQIQVGCKTTDEGQVIFVKDNGTGFNMNYSSRLFGAFQRLHSAHEFEGTGVGLTIVKRIIDRHGGRIWVDAVVDEGAVFYFTLPGLENRIDTGMPLAA